MIHSDSPWMGSSTIRQCQFLRQNVVQLLSRVDREVVEGAMAPFPGLGFFSLLAFPACVKTHVSLHVHLLSI